MRFLRFLWEGWKRIAHRIARFNSLVLTTILYFVVLPFVALPFRMSRDPLRMKGSAAFLERDPAKGRTFEEATRQG